ncbi:MULTISPECIES: FAD-dependent monooxygenase [unclassified Streptomyces]|uniref:FAD-dependent monooxygenase n=1 Tax=unclassified Streptomyces TaxID=2593676 RepID=UPI002DDA131C|nr:MULTISPECIES: FAD-dependent monooxygenase [unclassified Streptomyces]WSB74805.1 FAD-dependent monooxygenase [Streptomyces sp. NBC_01775]WSS16912.1 FAD-dependent monooxygenase [Streptomyces sp. NBC_01186]WSS45656.1 FAD-dependent monooxygenase [Streptomyces sp. NBC_01187]
MTHALIVGGGIAGAVTAMSLRKAGIDSTVYESYPTGADDVGAFLVLFHNGLEALRTVDAHQPVLDVSFPAERIEMLSHTGDSLGIRPVSGRGTSPGKAGEPGGGGEVLEPRTLRRAALYRALHDEAARRGIRIEHGKRLVSADKASDGRVTARFADGSSAEGDLLIGADGIHSVTRGLIDPQAPTPRHTGQTTVCGYAANVQPEAAPVPGTYRMIQGTRAFLGCTMAPGGEVWWFANTPGRELGREQLATETPAQKARWREHVAGLFAEDASPAADIVRATGDEIVASNAYDIASTPVWSQGPLIVLGDAAHAAAPNAAQGASMAIEDSVVLAKCLRDLGTPSEAFAEFERLRRERVEAVVERSAQLNNRVVPGRRAEPRAPGPDGSGPGASGPGGSDGHRDTPDDVPRTAPVPGTPRTGDANWLLHYRIDWETPIGAGHP